MDYSLCFSMTFLLLIQLIDQVSLSNDDYDPWEQKYGKIQHASVIFRHGDRSPYDSYPFDPYINYSWPQGLGQLTNEGKFRLYNLGKWFRKRYRDLTGKTYLRKRVLVQSSHVDRAIMSAYCFLHGLFPATGSQQWKKLEKWQPIPVHTIPKKYDNMIFNARECPRWKRMKEMMNESPRYQRIHSVYNDTIKYIENHTGWNFSRKTIRSIYYCLESLRDIFFVQTANNLKLPSWSNEIYPEPLITLLKLVFEHDEPEGDQKRFMAGPILESISSDMVDKVENINFKQTVHIYSGHDSTIIRILKALDAYVDLEPMKPPYGSALIFELRKNQTDHLVTVTYKSTTYKSPFLLYVPKCGRACHLERFLNVTRPLIPESWDQECQLTSISGAIISNRCLITMLIVYLLLK